MGVDESNNLIRGHSRTIFKSLDFLDPSPCKILAMMVSSEDGIMDGLEGKGRKKVTKLDRESSPA